MKVNNVSIRVTSQRELKHACPVPTLCYQIPLLRNIRYCKLYKQLEVNITERYNQFDILTYIITISMHAYANPIIALYPTTKKEDNVCVCLIYL